MSFYAICKTGHNKYFSNWQLFGSIISSDYQPDHKACFNQLGIG